MAKKYSKVIILIVFLIITGSTYAQGPPPPPPPLETPIDGGIIGLFIAGIAYGIRKIRQSEK